MDETAEKKAERRLLCPLRRETQPANVERPEIGIYATFSECYRQECAWWLNGKCAIPFIAETFLLWLMAQATSSEP
jgi:hypothetical protein